MALIISHEEPPPLTFFGDASSKEKDFMVAGGFAVAGSRVAEIESHIAEIRKSAGIREDYEFHWSDYGGGGKRGAYEALVQYAWELTAKRHAAFHVIIAEFKGYRHKAKPGENRDTSVNRMYYQLCLHRAARYYGKKRAIHIRLDAGNDSADICGMRNELCADAYKQYQTRPNCVRTLEAMASDKSSIMQMADVIIGGIASKRNGINHTSAKGPLSDLVLEASGHSSWATNTPSGARFLTVWNHKGKGGPP
jgi:hypothetical protein